MRLSRSLPSYHSLFPPLILTFLLSSSLSSYYTGALASRLHAHGKHGDPATKQLVMRIMDCVCAPLFAFVTRYAAHTQTHTHTHTQILCTVSQLYGKSGWRSTALCCTVLCCTALYCITLHCTVLHCTVLHCIALHSILYLNTI